MMAVEASQRTRKLVLVGNPNVGKSVIFRLLTGNYVMVSNYPGTTVEVSRGQMQLGGFTYEVVDTPGVHSLLPQSEDERVTCEILIDERPDLLIQVADAKNLRRTLLITSQLVEFGIPTVLVLNMMDEAEERGIKIDTAGLTELFGLQVVETVAIYSHGKRKLLQAVQSAKPPKNPLNGSGSAYYGDPSGKELPAGLTLEWLSLSDRKLNQKLQQLLGSNGHQPEHSARMPDPGAARKVTQARKDFVDRAAAQFKTKRAPQFRAQTAGAKSVFWLTLLCCGLALLAWNEVGGFLNVPTPFGVAKDFVNGILPAPSQPQATVRGLLRAVLIGSGEDNDYGLIPELIHFLFFIAPVVVPLAVLLKTSRGFTHELGILTRRASTGIPILVGMLVLVYEFVGYTGAQTLVGLVENVLFGEYLIPALSALLPAGWLAEFLVGKYGVISMGLSYSVGIVLPVVGTFFIAFSLLEDSGYLPRLSILADRVMRLMGLNGKATLPMVLGLGCVTMATMTTRILNSRKERFISTLLLALGVPCSAQLGVILGIAAGYSSTAILLVMAVVVSQLFLVGYLAAKLTRGTTSEFIFEIPPIRVPQMRNVWLKTWYRMQWYLKEAVPLFICGTLVLFVMDKVHASGRSLLDWMQSAFAPVLSGVLHLPAEMAGVFVLGFLRRDYGAAGLFDMSQKGMLSGVQVVVSLIVITLFVPCLASFLVIGKEHGLKKAFSITAFIIPYAVAVGGLVSWVLRLFDVTFKG
jgi:ferrous iron transport protein B